jgi:micrococcal nuclease
LLYRCYWVLLYQATDGLTCKLSPWRMRHAFSPRSWSLPLASVIFVALLVAFLNPSDPGSTAPDVEYVQRVVDGDTLLLGTGERVRLIGVDTPETKRPNTPVEYFGKETSAFPKRLAEGKRIRLEYDQANNHLGHKDQYGRTLAYIFLDDGTLLNAEIIRQGYGHAFTRYPFSRMEEFRRLEREAREQGRGLWAPRS